MLGTDSTRALGDAFSSLVGVGISSVFTLLCWASSSFLAGRYFVRFLEEAYAVPFGTSVCAAVMAAGVFLAASWFRLTSSGLMRTVGLVTSVAVMAAWTIAALRRVFAGDTDAGIALAVLSWVFVANVAAVKFADTRLFPGATSHCLYRFYDARERLLYIGITNSPRLRFAQHRDSKPWWDQVVTREISFYPSRAALAAAEKAAIRRERPLHNIAHNAGARR